MFQCITHVSSIYSGRQNWPTTYCRMLCWLCPLLSEGSIGFWFPSRDSTAPLVSTAKTSDQFVFLCRSFWWNIVMGTHFAASKLSNNFLPLNFLATSLHRNHKQITSFERENCALQDGLILSLFWLYRHTVFLWPTFRPTFGSKQQLFPTISSPIQLPRPPFERARKTARGGTFG